MNDKIFDKMKEFLVELLGINDKVIQPEVSIFQLGIDSVMMITVVKEINELFKVSLSLSDLAFKYNTLNLICDYIESNQKIINEIIAEDNNADLVKNEEYYIDTKDVDNSQLYDSNYIYKICLHQKETMEKIFSKQLDVLKEVSNSHDYKMEENVTNHTEKKNKDNTEKSNQDIDIIPKIENSACSNICIDKKKILTEKQKKMLEELVKSLTEKTSKSKKLVSDYRKYLADLDEIAGFNLLLKEIHYQISVESSNGSDLIDVDGNHYVDICMGFGSLILGHSPNIVINAIKKEIDKGIQLGPRHRQIGELAKLVCELTGFERANFTVTGTEAVMTAIKFARTFTGKKKIGVFTGCYHGHNDATLITKISKYDKGRPIASGISKETLKDTILFDYNDMSSIKQIEDMKDELAAVLVEPVQSRSPEVQPVEFLKSIRKITKENGILMIFDEIITGFRCNNGGAKRLFGINPDLATYGKAACNGIPIGIIAGKSEVMDVADGGQWEYSDESYPMVEQTFYAGTFFKHPFTVAAAHAMLSFYKENENALQEDLAEKTTKLTVRLNSIFAKYNIPIEVNNFTSLFRFKALDNNEFIDIFYYKLLDNGIFTWSGRTCFLSASHTDEDIEKIIDAVEKSVIDMSEAGFYMKSEIKNNFTKGIPNEVFDD